MNWVINMMGKYKEGRGKLYGASNQDKINKRECIQWWLAKQRLL